jgi:hypothetical protein
MYCNINKEGNHILGEGWVTIHLGPNIPISIFQFLVAIGRIQRPRCSIHLYKGAIVVATHIVSNAVLFYVTYRPFLGAR